MISVLDTPRAEPAPDRLDSIALSALQHWAYCPRQCGLIHLEQAFDENVHPLRGQAVHARVDKPGVQTAKGVRLARALPVWNDSLGLVGKADVVEFRPDGTRYPVEYKHGSRNKAAAGADHTGMPGHDAGISGHVRRNTQHTGSFKVGVGAAPGAGAGNGPPAGVRRSSLCCSFLWRSRPRGYFLSRSSRFCRYSSRLICPRA